MTIRASFLEANGEKESYVGPIADDIIGTFRNYASETPFMYAIQNVPDDGGAEVHGITNPALVEDTGIEIDCDADFSMQTLVGFIARGKELRLPLTTVEYVAGELILQHVVSETVPITIADDSGNVHE